MPPENNENIYDAITNIDFNSLLSAPLKACVDAQAQAASATADYIERTGFEYNTDNGKYTTRILTFSYTDEEGIRTIRVPLISVVPVPYLQIRNVDLSFTADVVVTKNYDGYWKLKGRVANNRLISGRVINGQIINGHLINGQLINTPRIIKGDVKSTSEGSESSTYESDFKVNVNIKASTADMPMGISRLLQVMQDTITVKEDK